MTQSCIEPEHKRNIGLGLDASLPRLQTPQSCRLSVVGCR